jgi:hypothetical protein
MIQAHYEMDNLFLDRALLYAGMIKYLLSFENGRCVCNQLFFEAQMTCPNSPAALSAKPSSMSFIWGKNKSSVDEEL